MEAKYYAVCAGGTYDRWLTMKSAIFMQPTNIKWFFFALSLLRCHRNKLWTQPFATFLPLLMQNSWILLPAPANVPVNIHFGMADTNYAYTREKVREILVRQASHITKPVFSQLLWLSSPQNYPNTLYANTSYVGLKSYCRGPWPRSARRFGWWCNMAVCLPEWSGPRADFRGNLRINFFQPGKKRLGSGNDGADSLV